MTVSGGKFRFWQLGSNDEREAALELLSLIIKENAEQLVSTFYSAFLQHPEGSAFLTHSVVQERLSHSLRNWLLGLLEIDAVETEAFAQRQVHIGEVHARVNIQVHLVLEGASLLKVEIARILAKFPQSEAVKVVAITMVDEIIDYAMRLMSASYVTGTKERAHVDEAFRLFSLGQDIVSERESQRAALMEWCQEILFDLATSRDLTTLQPLDQSPFGLWLRHRANLLFQKSNLLQSIKVAADKIDNEVLPAIEQAKNDNSGDIVRRIGELQAAVDEIKYLLIDMFHSAVEIESGRDPLTRTLNRKFLPSVLGRELTLSKKNDLALSIIMLDVDHFKSINDQYSHSAGDVVLRHVADTILEATRTSDFVFRYGGEEFLIVLVETDAEEALRAAERLRLEFEGHCIVLPDQTEVQVTISAGVATYEGHPDYKYFIDAADAALFKAKKSGRNRIVRAAAAG
jgi:diguanylate cyclase